MTGAQHATLGIAVIVVNLAVAVWAFLAWRRAKAGQASPNALTWATYLGIALLTVQVLVGIDLWGKGLRPAGSALSGVHVLAAVVALGTAIWSLLHWKREPARAAFHATTVIVICGLISYAIGEAGS